jgi:hypothetical protein
MLKIVVKSQTLLQHQREGLQKQSRKSARSQSNGVPGLDKKQGKLIHIPYEHTTHPVRA